ncbi:hypothetical protein AYO47_09255 [Planctomyces sp. SCGC AG-212-M04]|nr:hypothetical protein AYO47_09255 [Planctomyces sp. SCGC AG-212-M04]
MFVITYIGLRRGFKSQVTRVKAKVETEAAELEMAARQVAVETLAASDLPKSAHDEISKAKQWLKGGDEGRDSPNNVVPPERLGVSDTRNGRFQGVISSFRQLAETHSARQIAGRKRFGVD